MKRTWIYLSESVLCILVMILTACAPATPPATPAKEPAKGTTHEQFVITFYGTDFGRPSYVEAFAQMDLMNKYHPWIRGVIREASGSPESVMKTANDPQLRRTSTHPFADTSWLAAYKGFPPMDKPYPDVRFIGSMCENAAGLATMNPNIKTPSDLIGKKIATTMKGQGQNTLLTPLLEKIWGLTEDKVKYMRGERTDIIRSLGDGVVDAAFFDLARVGNKWIAEGPCQEILATKQVYFMSVPQADIDKLSDYWGYTLPTQRIPAGMLLANQPEFIWTGQRHIGVGAWKDMPDEVVYECLKVWDEHAKEFENYSKLFQGFKGSTFAELCPSTSPEHIHAGALKYYKDKGYTVGGARTIIK